MAIIYLKDGTIADLVSKTDAGYLVNPHYTYFTDEGEEDAPSGSLKIVQEVFDKAPVELIDADYQKILQLYEDKQIEVEEIKLNLLQLKGEVSQLERTKSDFSKAIFNRSEIKNAKRFIVFRKTTIIPFILDNKNHLKLSINYEISNYELSERMWVYKLSFDRWDHSEYFDEKYGLFLDLTDEEILSKCLERQNALGIGYFADHHIKNTPDQWLTTEFKEKKKELLLSDVTKKKSDIETKISDLQKELLTFKN